MTNNDKGNNAVVQIIGAVVVALLVGGTAPWWWQELISKEDTPTPHSTSPVSQSSEESESPDPPRRASINVAYSGDHFSCSLPISVKIGDKSFRPQGNFFQVNDVELDEQNYTISGQITCPTIGTCQVHGEGIVNVTAETTYYVAWQNTGIGECTAFLE